MISFRNTARVASPKQHVVHYVMSHKNKCAIYWYCSFLERTTVERVL